MVKWHKSGIINANVRFVLSNQFMPEIMRGFGGGSMKKVGLNCKKRGICFYVVCTAQRDAVIN